MDRHSQILNTITSPLDAQISSPIPAFSVTRKLHFTQGRKRRLKIKSGRAPERPTTRTQHICFLMALAIHFQQMLDSGHVNDLATLARYGQVTRARITQIMNLLNLAPDIQEKLLNLPQTTKGRDEITIKALQRISLEPDWMKQREMWGEQCEVP